MPADDSTSIANDRNINTDMWAARPAKTGAPTNAKETDHGDGKRQQTRTAADRGRSRPRKGDRSQDRARRHGGRDRQGGALALRQRDRSARGDRSEERRAASVTPHAGGRDGGKSGDADQPRRRAPAPSRSPDRRYHRRSVAAARIWPHRRAIGQAGDRAEGARGRARPAI